MLVLLVQQINSGVKQPIVSALKAPVYFSRLEVTKEPTSVCRIGICFADCQPDLAALCVCVCELL